MKKKTVKIFALSLCISMIGFQGQTVKAQTIEEADNGLNNAIIEYNEGVKNGTITPGDTSTLQGIIENNVPNSTVTMPDSSSSTTGSTTTTSQTSEDNSPTQVISTSNEDIKMIDEVANNVVISPIGENATTESNLIKLTSDLTAEDSYSAVLNTGLTFDLNTVIGTSIFTTMSVSDLPQSNNKLKVAYTFVEKNLSYDTILEKDWIVANNNTITIKNEGIGCLYLKLSINENEKIYKSTGFIIDKSSPVIKGVKNGAKYKTSKTLSFSDKISGIKKVTLNGKNIKNLKKLIVTKKGTYTVSVWDKAGNIKTLKFIVKK